MTVPMVPMEADDRALFARSLRQATEHHSGPALDTALVDLGWHDALDEHKGDAVALLFELQGKANTTSAALDDVLAQSLGVVSGAAIVLPPLGKWHPPARVEGDRLLVQGIATAALRDRKRAVVVWEQDGTQVAEIPAEQLGCRAVTGIDPALSLTEVTADLPLSTLSMSPAPDWTAAVAMGQVAIAHELVGACQAMLAQARTHALERVQFGRPIAGFQALRHRLADSLVAVEAAQACATAAWDGAVTPDALAATLAKAVAGASARTVGKHAQQVLGGMGYTTDHPLHRYVRRTLVLDQLLGASRTLTRQLGEQLLTTRRLPALLPL